MDESWASGQDMEEPKLFMGKVTVMVKVEAENEEDAIAKISADLYCGDIDDWFAEEAEELDENDMPITILEKLQQLGNFKIRRIKDE